MTKRAFGNSLPILGYAVLVAALFLFVRGYQFNTDDQAEHLPQVYQQLNPELYPNDYFVNASNEIFTVRHFYEKLVLFVAETIGLEWGLFWLTFACIALTAYSFARIGEHWFVNRWSVLFAPVLALIVFYGFTVGGNHVMYSSFISSTIAKGISAFGLLQFVREKKLFGGLLLGLATLFQPLVGLQLFLILGAVELLVRKNLKSTIGLGVSYLAVAAFILVPVFQRQFVGGIEYDKELYYDILYRFRNHHHYLPSLFPVTHYIKFFGLLILGVLSWFFAKPQDKKLFLGFSFFAIMGMLIYWVGLEYLNVFQIGKVQWFKTTIWVNAFSCIVIAGFAGELFSGLLPISKWKRFTLPLSFVGAFVLLLAITNSRFLPEKFQHKFMVGDRIYTDLEKMHFWIAEHTAVNASFLVSPDNNAFACQAQRSMPIHFQAIIHEPFFMLPWYEDFKSVYGVSRENQNRVDARSQAVELYSLRNYRGAEKSIDFRLDNTETCQFTDELGPVVHQKGNWILTEFIPQKK